MAAASAVLAMQMARAASQQSLDASSTGGSSGGGGGGGVGGSVGGADGGGGGGSGYVGPSRSGAGSDGYEFDSDLEDFARGMGDGLRRRPADAGGGSSSDMAATRAAAAAAAAMDGSSNEDDEEQQFYRSMEELDKATLTPLGLNNFIKVDQARYGLNVDLVQKKRERRQAEIEALKVILAEEAAEAAAREEQEAAEAAAAAAAAAESSHGLRAVTSNIAHRLHLGRETPSPTPRNGDDGGSGAAGGGGGGTGDGGDGGAGGRRRFDGKARLNATGSAAGGGAAVVGDEEADEEAPPTGPEFKGSQLSLNMVDPDSEMSRYEEMVAIAMHAGYAPDRFPWPKQLEMWVFFEHPKTRLAFIFSVVSMLFIAVSTLSVVIETWPSLYNEEQGVEWLIIEAVCVAFFTIEYALRMYASVTWWRFMLEPLNIIDLLAILPFFIDIILQSSSNVDLRFGRVIRLIRIIRVFKITRYSPGLQLTMRAVKKSTDALSLLLFYLIIAVVLFSCLIYYAERGTRLPDREVWVLSDGQLSEFQSVPDSFWWCLSTITTVGYGDAVPITPFGKVVASATMISGVMIIAFPTSILGTNFMSEWQQKQRDEMRRKHAEARKKKQQKKRAAKRSKAEQIVDLAIENETLLESVQFIQELLGEINPSAQSFKIHKMRREMALDKARYDALQAHTNNVEATNQALEQQVRDLQKKLDMYRQKSLSSRALLGDGRGGGGGGAGGGAGAEDASDVSPLQQQQRKGKWRHKTVKHRRSTSDVVKTPEARIRGAQSIEDGLQGDAADLQVPRKVIGRSFTMPGGRCDDDSEAENGEEDLGGSSAEGLQDDTRRRGSSLSRLRATFSPSSGTDSQHQQHEQGRRRGSSVASKWRSLASIAAGGASKEKERERERERERRHERDRNKPRAVLKRAASAHAVVPGALQKTTTLSHPTLHDTSALPEEREDGEDNGLTQKGGSQQRRQGQQQQQLRAEAAVAALAGNDETTDQSADTHTPSESSQQLSCDPTRSNSLWSYNSDGELIELVEVPV